MCSILRDVVVARLMMVVLLAATCLGVRRARVACVLVGIRYGTGMLYF